jgi:hypothetical protein
VDQQQRLFLRDLALILGLPGLMMASLLAWWKPWTYRPRPGITFSYETREAKARAAGVREATWRGLHLRVPEEYVILSQDSLLEILEWEPPDYGTGSWGSHLAFLPLTSEVRQRFQQQAENCGLAPGRCWQEQVGTHELMCQQAAGVPAPELWWTPLTVCKIEQMELWLALNAPEVHRPRLWEIAHGVLEDADAVDQPTPPRP